MSVKPKDLFENELKASMQGYWTQADVLEEISLLANSMSTHKALADKMGISDAYLCDIIAGRREPGPKVLQFLKLEKVIVYHDRKIDR